MKITEDTLKENLKLSKLTNLYYFYGREIFLVKTYADRVREKFAPDLDEFNLVKFTGTPDFSALEEAIETLPVFAESKVVILNDFDAEKTDPDTLERVMALLSDVPDYCTVIISITGFEPGKNAKTKKLLACAEKHGTVCEFEPLSRAKAADLIVKKASRLGCIISRESAEYLYELTLGSLTLIGTEVEKLCAFAGTGGEITRQVIDSLVPRLTETKIFELSKALTSKNAKAAFKIFNDLMTENQNCNAVLGYLSAVFVRTHHENLKSRSRRAAYTRDCVSLLYKANIKLRTQNERTVLEKMMTEILTLP
jgi:DNA polymerase-3 subunit delta